ncbi:MAG: hypothetical protein NXI01_07950 [Gammaproteobacteria bacterium]|nr:hypothetical protein [Gammaproteobacteria bacterium]
MVEAREDETRQLENEINILSTLESVYETESYSTYRAAYDFFVGQFGEPGSTILNAMRVDNLDANNCLQVHDILTRLYPEQAIDITQQSVASMMTELDTAFGTSETIDGRLNSFHHILSCLILNRESKIRSFEDEASVQADQAQTRSNRNMTILSATVGFGTLGLAFLVALPVESFFTMVALSGLCLLQASMIENQYYALTYSAVKASVGLTSMLGGYVLTALAAQTYISASFSAQFALLIGITLPPASVIALGVVGVVMMLTGAYLAFNRSQPAPVDGAEAPSSCYQRLSTFCGRLFNTTSDQTIIAATAVQQAPQQN